MTNSELYKDVFIKSLAVDKDKFDENLKYNEIPEWDQLVI